MGELDAGPGGLFVPGSRGRCSVAFVCWRSGWVCNAAPRTALPRGGRMMMMMMMADESAAPTRAREEEEEDGRGGGAGWGGGGCCALDPRDEDVLNLQQFPIRS